ncbi:hypothetical protein ACHQM5_022644 [Ranunculus cassubicifolius]
MIRIESKRNITKLMYGNWNDIELEKGLGVVRCTGAFGRKRIEPSPCSSPFRTPLKRQCSVKLYSEKSLLESLPQDILVRVLCGVEHEDLKQLQHVSKTIKEATMIAKDWHFAYRTPSKTANLHSYKSTEDEKFDGSDSVMNAPMQGKRHYSRTSGRNLADISVALFPSPKEY